MYNCDNLPLPVGATRKRGRHLRGLSLAWGISNRKLNESRCNVKGPSMWISLKMKSLFPVQSTGKKKISQIVADEIKAFKMNMP